MLLYPFLILVLSEYTGTKELTVWVKNTTHPQQEALCFVHYSPASYHYLSLPTAITYVADTIRVTAVLYWA